jgi:hypothetical protein
VTVGYGPLLRRDGSLPAQRNNTLLDVAQVITDDDDHWRNGLAIHSYPPYGAQGFDPCGTGSDHLKASGGAIPLPEFGPVQVYFPETCTAYIVGPPPEFSDPEYTGLPDDALRRSYDQVADARARGQDSVYARAVENYWFVNRAVIALGGAEEAQVENVLCNGGAVPANPHLTDANLVQLNGGVATNPVEGLALLEKTIGGTKKAGVIHASPATITYWSRFKLITEPTKAGLLYTMSGTSVVDGFGYIGAVPDAAGTMPAGTLSATEDWAFATGPLKIWREPGITVYPGTYLEALDRTSNTLTYFAERTYVITWDTALQAGVLIDRSLKP